MRACGCVWVCVIRGGCADAIVWHGVTEESVVYARTRTDGDVEHPLLLGAESTLFSSWVRLTTTSFLPFLESARPGLEGDVISSSPIQVAGRKRQFYSLRSFLNPLRASTQVKQGSFFVFESENAGQASVK